mgnify:CR=1 FL=1
MKKLLLTGVVLFLIATLSSSCYVYTATVGDGPQGNQEVTEWNHYLIYGLVPIGVSDAEQMAGGAEDYSITVKHSFVNGLLSGITFGIYAPTTTVVKK